LEDSRLKLHLVSSTGQNAFTAYGPGYVVVNGKRYDSSLVVLPEDIIEGWKVDSFEALSEEHFLAIVALHPEIVLFGTGSTFRFLDPRLSQSLAAANIGLEVMDTHAACRTFNILMGEGRRVAAAILPE
jgi:uncharacterized protein